MKPIEMAEPGLHKQICRLIDDDKYLNRPSHILDIASGQGALIKQLFDSGYYNLVAADINEENFKLKGQFNFIKNDLNKDIQINDKFDSILAIEVIEHIENPYKLIRDCYNLLHENGSLIISTPNITSFKSRISFLLFGRFNSFFPADRINSGHINPISLWELEDILKNNGFKVETIEQTRLNFAVVPKYSFKSLGLKMLYIIGLFIFPIMQSWHFRSVKSGNVIIVKARKQ